MKVKILKLKVNLIVATAICLVSTTSMAGSGAGGGATEATQMMNNGELVASVSKQSQLVAGQIRDYSQQVSQYTTMLQNLKNIPANVVAETLGPYKQQLSDLSALYQATTDVYTTSTEAYDTLERRRAEMLALKMTPSDYVNAEMLLAKTKGGIYKAQAERDIAAFKRAEEKSKKLAGMGEQINNVKGAVQGMQFLAQQNQVMAGELMEMNAQLREKSLQDKQAKEESMKEAAERKRKELEQMEAMRKRRDATQLVITNGKYQADEKRRELLKEFK